MENQNLLEKKFKDINITLSTKQIEQFNLYFDLLIKQNEVMNLTAITDYKDVVIKHFVDSLSLTRVIDLKSSLNVIDVGTGAGFPGIPLKIVFPHLNILLLDSLKKRLKFLEEVIDKLELNAFEEDRTITTIHGRSEDLAHIVEYRGKFDLCVSRAVANMSTLSEYCLPFVKVGGAFIAYKAGKVENELEEAKKAIYLLGGKLTSIDAFKLANTDMDRVLLKVDKISQTPKKYPRNAGTPKRDPI